MLLAEGVRQGDALVIGLKTGTTDQYQGTYLGYNDYGQRTSETSYRLELVGKRGSQVVSPSTPSTPGTENGGGPNPNNESGGAGSTPVAGWILNNQWVQSTVCYDYNADGQVVQGTLETLGENYREGQFVAGDAALQATNAQVLKVDYDQYGRIYRQESADQFGKLIAGAQLRQVVDTTYVDKTQQIDSSSVSNSSVNPDKATDGIKHSTQKSQYEYESFGNVKQVVTDITGEQSFQSITRYNYLAGSGQASSIVSSRSGASGEGIPPFSLMAMARYAAAPIAWMASKTPATPWMPTATSGSKAGMAKYSAISMCWISR